MKNSQAEFLSVNKKIENKKKHDTELNHVKEITLKEKIKYSKKEEFVLYNYGLVLNNLCS